MPLLTSSTVCTDTCFVIISFRWKLPKTCSWGDFNVDLLKIDQHEESNLFYNVLTANGFRPLILQPSRVQRTSATLIDNIFINDMAAKSKGGNLVCSISDHFLQFSSLDIFPKNVIIPHQNFVDLIEISLVFLFPTSSLKLIGHIFWIAKMLILKLKQF